MERKLTELIDKAVSRRTFLAGASVAAASTVITGCSGGGSAPQNPTVVPVVPTPQTLTDADYLNFALNLEYLEAEFYLHAATGTGLSAADSGNATSKTTVPASTQVTGLTTIQQQYIYEIAQNELDHVRLLRAALGSAAVAAPQIDLSASFNTLAAAANTATPAANVGTTFNPFASYNNYLIGAFIFEDVGVTAYHGAARFLTSSANLTVAAEIHAVEAYHAASIRGQIVATGSAALIAIANAVQTVRASLGGGMETTLGLYSASTGLVPANVTTSVGFERNLDQVMHIVYGTAGADVHSGVFFPAGLNGTITSTSA